jgi:hypothetical protein
MNKKVKNILVLGDSYIFGHGCRDRVHWIDENGVEYGDPINLYNNPSEFAWPSLLANRYPEKVNVYNLSMPGIDNLSLVSALNNFLDNSRVNVDLIIFNTSPAGRMLVANTTDNSYRDTPFLRNIIDLKDETKSVNWQVFRESKPLALRGGPHTEETFLKFAGLYYHDGLGVQMAMSSVLSAYSISQLLGVKFIWMSPAYCAAAMNMPLFPTKIRNVLTGHQSIHIADFQRRDMKKYSAEDGHSNEQCHEDYFNEVVKAKIASLGMF